MFKIMLKTVIYTFIAYCVTTTLNISEERSIGSMYMILLGFAIYEGLRQMKMEELNHE